MCDQFCGDHDNSYGMWGAVQGKGEPPASKPLPNTGHKGDLSDAQAGEGYYIQHGDRVFYGPAHYPVGHIDLPPASTGWICPRCDHVYAPHVDECKQCNGCDDCADDTVGVKIRRAAASPGACKSCGGYADGQHLDMIMGTLCKNCALGDGIKYDKKGRAIMYEQRNTGGDDDGKLADV